MLYRVLLDYQGGSFGRTPEQLLWATVVCSIHLAYLFLVTGILVFGRPLDRLSHQQVFLCFLLLAAYVANSAPRIIYNINSNYLQNYRQSVASYLRWEHALSYGLFAALYLFWFLRDWAELYHSDWPRERSQKKLWMIIEGILFVGLACMLFVPVSLPEFTGGDRSAWIREHTTAKDISLAVCLVVWALLKGGERLRREEYYRLQYLEYLKHTSVTGWSVPAGTGCLTASAGDVLDFGCGDGRRLLELLEQLYPGGIPATLHVHGIDRDAGWGPLFLQTFSSICEASFASRTDNGSGLANVRILHFSHVLYEQDGLSAALKLVKQAVAGTVVFVRGCAPRSLFYAISVGFAGRLFTPTYSHLWSLSHLPRLVERGGLVRLSSPPAPLHRADAVIAQEVMLAFGGGLRAADILRYLYYDTVASRAEEWFGGVERCSPSTAVANDDLLYVFRKQ